MITLHNVTLRRGPHVLFKNVEWTIYHKQRIGLIGANGSGKSSLFAMMQNQLHPDEGDYTLPPQLRIAHVAQETPATSLTALEYVLEGDKELQQIQDALTIAENEQDGTKIAELHEKLYVIDGYTATARAAQMLVGLNFEHAEHSKKVSEFSGGWLVRLNLAKALMCRSDMLLLDEPTNHLDLDAVIWLEQWLKSYTGTLILISHDRDFLDSTVDHIAFLSDQSLRLYTGNYSTFEKNYAAELLIQQTTYEKQQKQVAHLMSFVNRFKASAAKARQAQSRMKAIEKMDLVCAVQTKSPFNFEFRVPDDCPYPLIQLQQASIAYGERTILRNINLSLIPKERIAILGPNGAGKSSLIKLLAGEIAPSYGIRETASGLKIGYFAQHQVDHLSLNENALEHLRRIASRTMEQDLRKYLGSFGFSGDTVLKEVKTFSGGEKSRLALALLVWQKPNLLLLDEPTNHLDLEMRQALSLALQNYEGAMILVSHDRFLVRSTTDQLMLVSDGKIEAFDGDLDDYQKWLVDYRKRQAMKAREDEKSSALKKNAPAVVAEQQADRNPLSKKVKKIEEALQKLEEKMNKVELQLAAPDIYESHNKVKLAECLQLQASLKANIEEQEAAWIKAHEGDAI